MGGSEPLFLATLPNGDVLRGVIRSLDEETLHFDIGLTEPLKIPRAHLVKLEAALNATQLLYQGPQTTGEWAVGYRGKNWRYEEGRLISESYSSTGRELTIPDKARIEFEVSLSEDPTLNVFLAADNPRNGGDSYYYLQLTRNVLTCQRYWRDHPRTYIDLTKEFENRALQETFLQQPHVHLAIEIDREEKRVQVFLNGQLHTVYRDPAPRAPQGSALLFASYGNGTVRVEDIRLYALNSLTRPHRPLAVGEALFEDGSSRLGNFSIKEGNVLHPKGEIPLTTLRGARFLAEPQEVRDSSAYQFHLVTGGILQGRAQLSANTLILDHALLGETLIPLAHVEGLVVSPSLPAAHAAAQGKGSILLKNGDRLTGKLLGWTAENGLAWQRGEGEEALRFPPEATAEVRWPPSTALPPAPAALALRSGDDLPGRLTALDDRFLHFETTFSQPMKVPLAVVRTVHFSEPSETYFQGPGKWSPWSPSPLQGSWSEHAEGGLLCTGPGSVARTVPMPESGRVDVEFSWLGRLDLSITLFAQDLHRPVQPSTYRLHCENEQVTLYRGLTDKEANAATEDGDDPLRNRRLDEQLERFSAQFGGGATRRLGSPVTIPFNAFRRTRQIALCWDRETARLALLVDGKPIHIWEDPNGLVNPRAGLLFHQHGRIRQLHLVDVRVRGWNGVVPDPPLSDKEVRSLTQPLIRLRNEDAFSVNALRLPNADSPLRFESPIGALTLPLDRLRHLQFPYQKSTIPFQEGMAIDAHLYPKGLVRAYLTKIDDGQMHVSSPYHGDNVLDLKAFHKLTFDLQDRTYWDRQTPPWPRAIPVSMRAILASRQPPTAAQESAPSNDGSQFNESVEFDE